MDYTAANLSHLPRLTVLIAPQRYDPERLTIRECIEVVSGCQVRARGWYYPHINRDGTRVGPHGLYVRDETDIGDHIEQWRMYRSGQFVSRMVPWEVPDGESQEKMRKNSRPWDSRMNIDDVPGLLSFIMLILNVSEVYLFAASLAQAARYDTAVDLQVGLRGIQGWALGSNEQGVHLNGAYIAGSNIIDSTRSIPLNKLIAEPLEEAVVSLQTLFEQFGWFTIADDTIRNWQRRYLRV